MVKYEDMKGGKLGQGGSKENLRISSGNTGLTASSTRLVSTIEFCLP